MNFLPRDLAPEKIPAWERVLLGLWLSSDRGLAVASIRRFLAPGYLSGNIYGLVSKMAANGLILQTQTAAGYQLAPAGLRLLYQSRPVLSARASDNFFHCLIVGGQTKSPRIRISNFFIRWHIGRLTRGVYLTPFKAAIAEFNWRDDFWLGRLDLGRRSAEVADHVWRLQARNRTWRLLADRLAAVSGSAGRRHPQPIFEDFLQMVVSEPMLPPNLLPKPYWLELAKKRINAI